MADVRSDKQVKASTAVQRRPSQEALPEIAWLAVADLLVDYSYQHRPYASAIDQLNKGFQEAYSGFILVNERTDGSRWILDGQTRHAVHQLRDIQWIRAEMLHGLTQAQEAEVYLLNLPMAKARGFRTPDHSGSRGPFRPRGAACIAPTLGAPEHHLSADAQSPPPKRTRWTLVLTPRWFSAYPPPSRLYGKCLGDDKESKQHPLQP